MDESRPWKAGKASGKDGIAVFDGLPAGLYEVRAMRNGGSTLRQAQVHRR